MRKAILMSHSSQCYCSGSWQHPWRPRPPRARGMFTVQQFSLTSSPVPVATHCLLEGNVELTFTGTLEGSAAGPIRILVGAPCQAVAEHPRERWPIGLKPTSHSGAPWLDD
jgi:hypothetical protein